MKIKKMLLLTMVVIMTGLCRNVPAAEKKPERLSVDLAVKRAIAANTGIKNYDDNTKLSNDSLKALKDELLNELDWAKCLSLLSRIMQAEAQMDVDGKENESAKQNLTLSVTKFFAAVIKEEKSLELYDQNMLLEKKQLEIAKVKLGLGMLSRYDYDNQVNACKQKENEREAKVAAIEDAYVSLNKTMGSSVRNRYELMLEYEYETIGERNLSYDISNAIELNTSIMSQQNKIDTINYNLENYDDLELTESKESLEITREQTYRAIADTKANVEQKVIQSYNTIKSQETQYETYLLKLESLNSQLVLKEKQLELGKTTQLEVDKQKYSIAEQEESIRSLVVNHAINIIQFKMPNTL